MNGYEMMNVTGPVSVQLLAHEELRSREARNLHLILLLGPTGSGKSTFVECIGNDRSIQISGNKLDGVTQDLMIYRLHNVYRLSGLPIYLMDTPGFADDKFPETKVLRMIQSSMEDYKLGSIKRILYFNPITDLRMTSSKVKILRIMKTITGLSTEKNLTIVTTMWNQLWREDQITRANQRLADLQTVYWRSLVEAGTPVVKFDNTHKSAMEALTSCMDSYNAKEYFVLERMLWDNVAMSRTTAGFLLYENLLERISGLRQRARSLDDGLAETNCQEDPLIRQVLLEERENVMAIMETVEQELKLLGPPSSFESNLVETESSSEYQEQRPPAVSQRHSGFHRKLLMSMRSELPGGWAFIVPQSLRMMNQRSNTIHNSESERQGSAGL